MEINNDDTLEKNLNFSIWTRRWGHFDTYILQRTDDGWRCSFLSINGKCEKDGEGAFIENLKHDCVFFPEEGVRYAMSKLWEDANESKIGLDQLQQRLQDIADWISDVEKNVIIKQPTWINYF